METPSTQKNNDYNFKAMKETFVPEPTGFTQVNNKRHPNAERPLGRPLATDEASFTGPEQGFFTKFGSDSSQ